MSRITTHVLDIARGRPASGVSVRLERDDGDDWEKTGSGTTDEDGRIGDLGTSVAGVHRITFDTGAYFATQGTEAFYPEVSVVFRIADPGEHHHVPLLVSPFGYTTYRGS